MAELRLTVIDPSGLHARPAARFVQAASRFRAGSSSATTAARPTPRASSPCSA